MGTLGIKEIRLDECGYKTALAECIEYADSEQESEQKIAYLYELGKADECKGVAEKFAALLKTGIFHDAVGKVLFTLDGCAMIIEEH